MKRILPLFSYLLHPVFVPVFAAGFYCLIDINAFNTEQKWLIVTQIAIVTLFIPLCVFFFLRSLGKIDSVMLSNLSQRKIPLLLQAVLLYLLITKSIRMEVIPELFFFLAAGMFTSMLALALTFAKIKASLHMAGISALTVFVIGLSIHNQTNMLLVIAAMVALNGILASSRLEMKAHSYKELGIGILCGLLPQLVLGYAWL